MPLRAGTLVAEPGSAVALGTPTPSDGTVGRVAVLRMFTVPLSAGRLLAASAFFATSLTPSLYPRPWVVQGVLSGVAVALGVATATIARPLVPVPAGLRVGPRFRGRVAIVVSLTALVVALWALSWNYRWQVDVRRIMEVDGNAAVYLVKTVLVAIAAAYAFILFGRATRLGVRQYARLVSRIVPPRGSAATHLAITIVVAVVVVDVIIAGQLVARANDRLLAADASSDLGVAQPASPYLSGSSASLAPWTTLGRMGRSFVADAPTVDQLTAFNGSAAMPPIRAYVGLQSAASVRERAELAVAELERAGAFDREVLIVVTPTGTGSVNRYAIAPLEYMYNGNTAAVAVQYSYLPSWIVMGGNQDRAAATATALFEAVERALARRPATQRPLVLLYGESLGSFGSEQVFADLASMRERVDGVLWIGPPRANRLWRQLLANRDPQSPVWRPTYRDGVAVRFGADGADLLQPNGRWTVPRVAYLQHGSDPVTWWSPDLLFRRPPWLGAERPRDISKHMPYVPVVTFLQTTIDTVLGGSAPMHHGHIYGTEQAEAWALIAPPGHWTSSDTLRLGSTLADYEVNHR